MIPVELERWNSEYYKEKKNDDPLEYEVMIFGLQCLFSSFINLTICYANL